MLLGAFHGMSDYFVTFHVAYHGWLLEHAGLIGVCHLSAALL